MTLAEQQYKIVFELLPVVKKQFNKDGYQMIGISQEVRTMFYVYNNFSGERVQSFNCRPCIAKVYHYFVEKPKEFVLQHG